ncbi:hypothetical protein DEG02_012600 [Xanthomonas vasicola]|uniref:Uncharacterized protein n=1 Tax=Xanthomonas vasicola TaxID=56459 RepID=A0ABD7SEW2_XANVA|nr:hypothetical protein NX81_007630 [Xanthomonas vasicola]AZR26551.1 hypothetical protein NX80_008680 [Xanthomonas vasicola pv. arecae]AZR30272.1 hypothetical protein KWO_006705 [Xanthomonas vasicola pv. musacearum NCPPB 4379]RRJ37921.1 hypothetical protein EIM46_16265 [Xanthomonas vasicola pv. musacearum]PPV04018.1 hypothetical protein XvhCFBP2543_03910 [Xanthomonas vasicola]
MRRHCLPPVRQLKIFFPTAALPRSHEQKCANLLRASIAMHASARIDYGMHRIHRRRNATGNSSENFSPSARQTLTNDSRQKSGACR